MAANFEPTGNTYYILYTNSGKDVFRNYFIANRTPGGGSGVKTISIDGDLDQIDSYTTLSAFNTRLSQLKIAEVDDDPFALASTDLCPSIDQDGFCVVGS
jgi:hypothetical protein